uniref:Uncharacterized protein n=1 Tax=Arundo donax TaxID=35708 RepID=A0A0A9CDI8_ARUDO
MLPAGNDSVIQSKLAVQVPSLEPFSMLH